MGNIPSKLITSLKYPYFWHESGWNQVQVEKIPKNSSIKHEVFGVAALQNTGGFITSDPQAEANRPIKKNGCLG